MLLVHVVILHRVGEIKAYTSERSLTPGGNVRRAGLRASFQLVVTTSPSRVLLLFKLFFLDRFGNGNTPSPLKKERGKEKGGRWVPPRGKWILPEVA